MTAGERKERIEREMRAAALGYGKLGLLIDDQRDAESWVARELYAADALPAWWKVIRSMECAADAVASLRDIMRQPVGSLRALCIVDRYLPTECLTGYIPVAWDRASDREEFPGENESRKRVIQAFAGLGPQRGWQQDGFKVVYVTSYPFEPRHLAEAPQRWRTRIMEQLHQLRREIESEASLHRLLRFGPEHDAPIAENGSETWPMTEVEVAEARWRARSWKPVLLAVTGALAGVADGHPAVLLTGSGASLAQGPHGAGMPETQDLLRQATRYARAALAGHAYEQEEEPPRYTPRCSCERHANPSESDPLSRPSGEDPVSWVMDNIESGRKLDWHLEELLNVDLHQHSLDSLERFWKFHRAFRDVLYEHDDGYPYHHWLLARMPWTAILTTNFDGFHERGAAAAAHLPWLTEKQREHCLALGSLGAGGAPEMQAGAAGGNPPAAPPESRQPYGAKASADGSAKELLFKPYGSLYKPGGELAFSSREIKRRQADFEKAFGRAAATAGRGGTLVVIGHSMLDPFIAGTMNKAEEQLQGLQLVWVDPVSYRRSSVVETTFESHRWWDDQLRQRREDCEYAMEGLRRSRHGWRAVLDAPARFSGPVPAKGHEFVFDLWRFYQRGDSS